MQVELSKLDIQTLDKTISALMQERARREAGGMMGIAEQPGKPVDTRNNLPGAYAQAPEFDLDHLFTYHGPEDGIQVQAYDSIRSTAKYFAEVILRHTPAGADRTAAIRKLRECVMTANAAIALRGRS
jgi:hypothetical protein